MRCTQHSFCFVESSSRKKRKRGFHLLKRKRWKKWSTHSRHLAFSWRKARLEEAQGGDVIDFGDLMGIHMAAMSRDRRASRGLGFSYYIY
ncbi:hypothetical protein VIGAN_UM046300 [Vigna angularis var. angularis]|uniref:Uncharacterized protein n=1 Tax=Vigna angularis var. angularis TaxID=157739 RepID=A0A0S3TDL6_PHAAN|nr:hypothetical protein VIGAN_UM046300 [Vigna angularis var. angularis]